MYVIQFQYFLLVIIIDTKEIVIIPLFIMDIKHIAKTNIIEGKR